jgi:hypothetical protein
MTDKQIEPYTIEEERAAWQAKLDEANAEVERLRSRLAICKELFDYEEKWNGIIIGNRPACIIHGK